MSAVPYNKSMSHSLRVVLTIRPKAPNGFFWRDKDGYLSVSEVLWSTESLET